MQSLDTCINRRILLIDDNPAIHEDFRKILEPAAVDQGLLDAEAAFFGEVAEVSLDLQVEIDSADQGRGGLEKVIAAVEEGRPYAMAFVDMRMPPGWDGLTTIEHLWKADPDLQVVICTAYSDNSWTDICKRLGETDQLLILKKPFDNVEVCQLALALTKKWSLQRQARLKQNELRQLVDERTAELREMDAALRQKQKLEAIGSLAGGVAHEFNNLLQAIIGYTRFAQEGLDTTDQRFNDLTQVINAGNRAATLTSQLLSFSRTDEYDPQPTETAQILDDLARLLKPVIAATIVVRIEPPEAVSYAMVDPAGLQQVLLNLSVNARDAMPAGGELTIRTENATLSARDCERLGGGQPGPYVAFCVTDTGMGMSSEQASRIFEPFFTTKEVGKGTGLGLAMVHGYVESHGGTIDVSSEVGAGTTFRILLPAADQVADQKLESEPEAISGGHETLLIADDEPFVLAVGARILTNAGYRVLTATNGAEAVDAFAKHQDEIALTLLDAVMPKLTGRQAFGQIRQIDADAPVIFCSGYDPDAPDAESLREEILPLVQKPYEPNALLQAVRESLDKSINGLSNGTFTLSCSDR